ncbi:MAG: hypothetical protein RLZZ338_2043 [Cyanobacteriota bacterium]|jgi:hypothetical protein
MNTDVWPYVGRNETRLYYSVGGVGAGLLRLFVRLINLGERAPTFNRFEISTYDHYHLFLR